MQSPLQTEIAIYDGVESMKIDDASHSLHCSILFRLLAAMTESVKSVPV